MIIDLSSFLNPSLLVLRIVVAIVFFSSGKSHISSPLERGKEIGLSKEATLFLGIIEALCAVSIAFGIYIQIGSTLLIIVMLGAIFKKIVVWNTGFYSEEGYGWHYDLLLLCANLIFLTYGGKWMLIS